MEEGRGKGEGVVYKKQAREKVNGFSLKSFFADARVEMFRARGHGCMNARSGVERYKGFWHWFTDEGRHILFRRTRGIVLENMTGAWVSD